MAPLLQEALRIFLEKYCNPFNADLCQFVRDNWPMEVQVNVKNVGQPINPDKPTGWRHDGSFPFGPFRFPVNAGTAPGWEELIIGFPLEVYAESIGTTGYSKKGSLAAQFDFDTIADHAEGIGISDAEMQRMEQAIANVPYAELRRSTGGAGRHVRVFLSGFTDVANHTEHAALCRAIQAKLSHDANIDLSASVDACGGNFWFWSRRATEQNRGFELLKPATTKLTPADVPNWRDHVDVVTRKRAKVKVEGLDEEFASSHQHVKRDAQHDAILAEYERQGGIINYQQDHNCYLINTGVLAKTHKALELKGAFETTSDAKHPTEHNAAAFLLSNGAMLIVRFGSAKESLLWQKAKSGAACIRFNVSVDPQAVCRAVEGVWTGKGFTCATVEQANRAAAYFGITLPNIDERQITFTLDRTGLLVTCERRGRETPGGWAADRSRLKSHFSIDAPPDDADHDEIVRHLQTPKLEDAGWALRRKNGTWGIEKKDTCRDAFASIGLNKNEASAALGHVARSPWTLVNEPFSPEFLAGRRWNRHGRRLIVPGTPGNHYHFDLIFSHCGKMLDEVVANDPWCIENGVTSGKRYLLLWAASLVQRPKNPLPYLFLWSKPNNTGKSALHRSLGMLIEDGATDCHSSLIEHFNASMAGAVLCFVEEASLPPASYAKLKNWVDSPTITIREMHTNAYPLPNFAKFIHTANRREACPIEDGDERIVVIPVKELENQIAWKEIMAPALQNEAASFLATLLYDTPLPPAAGRLFLPVLTTPDKLAMMGQTVEKNDTVKAVVNAVAKLITHRELFDDHGGDLLKAIGSGPWSNSPATLVTYLKKARDPLREMGINVAFSALNQGQHRITIGPYWLVDEADPTAEEIADELLEV
jgi:hypothetical protein